MKVDTHVQLAKLAIRKTELLLPEWNLSEGLKKLIILGTIEADFIPMRFVHRHFYSRSGKYILDKLDAVLKGEVLNKFVALEFGYILHYLNDFCCYVHRGNDIGVVSEHIQYENDLEKAFYTLSPELKLAEIDIPPVDNTIEYIKSMIEKYSKEEKSFETDLNYALQIATSVVFNVVQSIYKYEHVATLNKAEESFVAI